MRRTLLPLFAAVLLASCEKEITVDLPRTEPYVVVEGTIESGEPPFVLLTRTQSYFDPTSISSIASSFISDAVVTVTDGTNTYVLDRICSGELSEIELQLAAAATGIDIDLLRQANICAWTKLDNTLLGEEGHTYRLDVQTQGKTLTSTTTLPHAVALDSLWFKLAERKPDDDSLGFIWARMSDPDTIGNNYRWLAKRISHYASGDQKDATFIAPLFGSFWDRYVNGLSFDFNYNRGSVPYSDAEDDNNEEGGYFKRGDTVVVKFASIGIDEYRFYNSFATNVSSQGDLFSNPANVVSNVQGGLGIWAGWGTRLDTVVCVP